MIPPTFLQGLGPQTLQPGSNAGKGKSSQADGFADVLGRTAAGQKGGGEEVAPGGNPGLSGIEKTVAASGCSLESQTADGEALAEFGSMLVEMGFDTAEVDEMVSALEDRATAGILTFADLFEGAFRLTAPDTDPAALLDVSAMSGLKDILGGLGVGQETSRRLLSDALTADGQSIDLKALAGGIRQVLADGSEAACSDAGSILERLENLGLAEDADGAVQEALDGLILAVSRFNDLQDISDETDGSDGLAGSLLIAHLQQLTASLGEEGQAVESLIVSAGKEGGGFDGTSLLSRLVQMKQEMDASPSGTPPTEGESGQIGLERFAAILERRTAASDGAGRTATATRVESMGGGSANGTPAAKTPGQDLFPVDPEGDGTLKAEWQPDTDRSSSQSRLRKAAGSAFDTMGKQEGGSTNRIKQTTLSGGTDRQFSDNASGKQTADRFGEILNSSGREKSDPTPNTSGINAENLVRDLKAGGETASMARSDSGRNLPTYLLNQVSRQIVRLRNAGETEMSLQLKPPHLGRMKLNIESTAGGGMRVGIVVESSAAKDMLIAHSHELKASLADQGLRLDQIDVDAQSDFGQSMAQADQGFERFGGGRNRLSGQAAGDSADTDDDASASPGGASPGEPGRLDLVA